MPSTNSVQGARRLLLSLSVLIAAGLFLAGCGGDEPDAKAKRAPKTASDASAAAEAAAPAEGEKPSGGEGQEAEVGDYRIRIPEGFEDGPRAKSTPKKREGEKFWHKPAEGESEPLLTAFVSEQEGDLDPDKFLPVFMEANLKLVANDCTDFKSTKDERQQLSGIEAFRGTFEGKLKKGGRAVAGVIYVLIDDPKGICLCATDTGPEAATGVEKLDEALKGFHKAGDQPAAASDDPDAAKKANPNNPVLVTMNLAPLAVEFVKGELKKAAGEEAGVTAKLDGEGCTFTIRPGGDIKKLAKKIAFGSVSNIDEETRTISVDPDPMKIPQDPAVIVENPAHPEYLQANLTLLKGANPEQRQAALEKLVAMDPSKAPTGELKKEAAWAMRDRALDPKDTAENRIKAVEGLIVWAGAFSAPVLVEVLRDKDATVRQAALKGLENYKDERAIEPLVQLAFGQGEDRDAAMNALKGFGSSAEDAVLKHAKGLNDAKAASPASPETLRVVVALLGEVGTKKKGLKYLGTLVGNKRFPELREDVQRAMQMINMRDKRPSK